MIGEEQCASIITSIEQARWLAEWIEPYDWSNLKFKKIPLFCALKQGLC